MHKEYKSKAARTELQDFLLQNKGDHLSAADLKAKVLHPLLRALFILFPHYPTCLRKNLQTVRFMFLLLDSSADPMVRMFSKPGMSNLNSLKAQRLPSSLTALFQNLPEEPSYQNSLNSVLLGFPGTSTFENKLCPD